MNKGSSRRWLLAAATVFALGVFFLFLFDRVSDPDTQSSSRPPLPAAPAADNATVRPSPQSPVEPDLAWEVIDPDTVDELPPYKEMVAGRALVRISEELLLGTLTDQVVLAVPQIGQIYEGVIEEVETDAWGNVSYVGLVRGVDGRDYRFLITAGLRNTFAHIGTPRGTFELVATGGTLGWLMPTANMDQHVDYSKPDYYLPGQKAPRPWEDETRR